MPKRPLLVAPLEPRGVRKAAAYFQQAIESDPTYACAYSGLADCLYSQGYYGYGRPRDLMPRAKAYALKALELDPQLSEAHCSLALLESAWEWNSRECGRLLRRCLELNPNYATAIAKYASSYLSNLDRYEEASDWLRRALVLDPLSANVHADLAINSGLRGLDECFEQEAARVLEMDPAMVKLYWFQIKTRGARGNWPGAVEAAECALRHMPDPVTLGFAAAAHAGFGNAGRAAELRGKLEALSQVRYVPYAPVAYAHDEPGGEEAFFRLMKLAVEERSAGARTLRVMRRFIRFASDPRYDALLESVGLSDQDVAQAAAVDVAS